MYVEARKLTDGFHARMLDSMKPQRSEQIEMLNVTSVPLGLCF